MSNATHTLDAQQLSLTPNQLFRLEEDTDLWLPTYDTHSPCEILAAGTRVRFLTLYVANPGYSVVETAEPRRARGLMGAVATHLLTVPAEPDPDPWPLALKAPEPAPAPAPPLTRLQAKALAYYAGEVLLRESGGSWFPGTVTANALIRLGYAQLGVSSVLITRAGREALDEYRKTP